MACKEKVELLFQTLEKERSDLLKERELVQQQIEALNSKLSNMKETPLDLKYRHRVLQPMESLAVTSATRKRRVQATSYTPNKPCVVIWCFIIVNSFCNIFQGLMDVHVNCRKFIGDVVAKNVSDKIFVLKHAIKKRDFISILRDPRQCALWIAVLQEVINDLKSIVNLSEVVQA